MIDKRPFDASTLACPKSGGVYLSVAQGFRREDWPG